MTRRSPARQHRLDQRREIHRAAGDRAGADGGMNFVDEEDRPWARAVSALMTALNRSSKSPRKRVPASSDAGVEREDLARPSSASWTSSASSRVREAFGHRRLADAGVADEHRIVLAPAAQHLDGALQFVGAADQRVEQPLPRACRSG